MSKFVHDPPGPARPAESTTATHADPARAPINVAPGGATPTASPPSSPTLPDAVFYRVVEESSLAIAITDRRATILYVNPAFERITGYGREAIIGARQSILASQFTPRHIYRQMWQRLSRGAPWSGQLLNRRHDGSHYVAELSISPIGDGPEGSDYFLGIHRDVTDIQRLQQELRNQKTLIEAVLDGEPMPVAVLDADGQVVLDNHAYKALVSEMGSGEPARRFCERLKQHLGSEQFHARWKARQPFHEPELSIPIKGKDTRWFALNALWFQTENSNSESFFSGGTQDYLLCVATDITGLKTQQDAVRRNALRALLAEQEHQVSMREALLGAIYQLQGPLNVIASARQLLDRRAQTNAHGLGWSHSALQETLDEILEKGNVALERIRDSLPEQTPSTFGQVHLNAILREILSLFTERLLGGGITIEWRPERTLPTVSGCEASLRSLFKQLVQNAVEAMEATRDRHRDLRIETQRADDWVTVIIQDSGSGIPVHLHRKVFEPFFTTKGGHGNAGMGLVMVQNALNQHAGLLHFDRDYPKGCRVRVSLPLNAPGVHGGAGEPTGDGRASARPPDAGVPSHSAASAGADRRAATDGEAPQLQPDSCATGSSASAIDS